MANTLRAVVAEADVAMLAAAAATVAARFLHVAEAALKEQAGLQIIPFYLSLNKGIINKAAIATSVSVS